MTTSVITVVNCSAITLFLSTILFHIRLIFYPFDIYVLIFFFMAIKPSLLITQSITYLTIPRIHDTLVSIAIRDFIKYVAYLSNPSCFERHLK
ncbi:hypothetical protein AB4K20DRAFT_1044842 [Rhizopus microsporus]